MIQLEITGVRYELSDKIKDYINKKIGKLDRYLPKHARESVHGEIILTEEDGKKKNRFTAEGTIRLPHETVTAKESTITMYAAIDIVEDKLKTQVLKYKEKQQKHTRDYAKARRMKEFRFKNPFQRD